MILYTVSLMVSATTQVSLLRRHGSHSPGQLSLVEAKDGLALLVMFIFSYLNVPLVSYNMYF